MSVAPSTPRSARGLVAAGVLSALMAAWLIGLALQGRDKAVAVADVLPGAQRTERRGDVWVAWGGEPERLIGYAAIGRAPGYAGPIDLLVAVDPQGVVVGLKVLEQRE
ncbi:MAG: hypothetical protein NTW86_32450, partial [Candidatus Sumerlaeota bacterium]|nr:hypothetical protein [Candidatus Sumerlaeota bacterium]